MNDTSPEILQPLADPVLDGLARGWKVIDASSPGRDLTLEADVAIVGTGAGGGIAAEILADAGLRVLMVEEGPLKSSTDFRMREADAYRDLYQESAARKTADKAINILQGRCVGGGTTVNWTSSFRTPAATLAHWQATHGWSRDGAADLAPWFDRVEARLGIAPWLIAPNANNAALARGAATLGIHHDVIRRNVRGCWNLGYCGMGCPTNAKQSMLVTTIPHALDAGATLVTRARALRYVVRGDDIESLECVAMDATGTTPTTRRITVRARTFVTAAGAIGSQRCSGPVRDDRRAHVPASDSRFGRIDAGTRRRLRRCAANDLFGPVHGRRRRRAHRLQARGAARAPGARGDHAARAWHTSRRVDAPIAEHAGADRAAARRLSR
jgi:hypothetical protein